MGKIKGRYQSDNWNPWEGCRKCSEACKHCFLFPRLFGRDMDGARRCKTTWDKPWGWQKAAVAAGGRKTVGLCFCSDFLIEEADPWRQEAWATIRDTPNLTWMFCSKRTKRLADCLPSDWGKGYPNVAIGASFENKKHFDRIGYIQAVPGKPRAGTRRPSGRHRIGQRQRGAQHPRLPPARPAMGKECPRPVRISGDSVQVRARGWSGIPSLRPAGWKDVSRGS
jgi:hypothetical protein